MKKSDLQEGMKVRNTRSGTIGEIRDLDRYHERYVSVRCKVKTGKGKGNYYYTFWYVKNLEIIST